jgi:hypothetical protein
VGRDEVYDLLNVGRCGLNAASQAAPQFERAVQLEE